MSGFRALSSHLRTHFKSQDPLKTLFQPSSVLQRSISVSPQVEDQTQESKIQKAKKPLVNLFKESVGLRLKSESESEGEVIGLKKKLKELEREVRRLKSNTVPNEEIPKKKRKKEEEAKQDGVLKDEAKPKSLHSLFLNRGNSDGKIGELSSLEKEKEEEEEEEAKQDRVLKDEAKPKSLHSLFSNRGNSDGKIGELSSLEKEEEEEEEPVVLKEFSEDMLLLVSHLHKEGYLKDANFLPRGKLIPGSFHDSYARHYLKFAAERFGRDNQEIAKWLSGSDLKKMALFGCPSLARRSVFAAKRLRTFFRIQEELVCRKCVLKQSCKFVNQSVWRGDTKNLNLSVTMRLIILYAMDLVSPKVVVPDEIKASVSRLLKEILKLSKTVA